MKLVIDIPDEAYQKLLEEQHLPNRLDIEYFIIHGTPLPKGYGDLIDRDILWDKLAAYSDNEGAVDKYGDSNMIHKDSAMFIVENAPTVIEADMEGEQE